MMSRYLRHRKLAVALVDNTLHKITMLSKEKIQIIYCKSVSVYENVTVYTFVNQSRGEQNIRDLSPSLVISNDRLVL